MLSIPINHELCPYHFVWVWSEWPHDQLVINKPRKRGSDQNLGGNRTGCENSQGLWDNPINNKSKQRYSRFCFPKLYYHIHVCKFHTANSFEIYIYNIPFNSPE